MFTGYSSTCVALALPEGGRLVACDVSEEYTNVARRYWRLAGVEQRIDLRLGPALATLDARRACIDEVESLISRWTEQQELSTVVDALRRVGVEAVPVADFVDVAADEQLAHRGHFVTMDHLCMGPCGYERNGFRLSDAPAGYERTSPLLGEHNEWVLGEILELDSAEQARLRDAGALE